MRCCLANLLLLAIILLTTPTLPALADPPILFGTVASSPSRARIMIDHQITIATYVILWDQLEPQQGKLNSTYIAKVKADLQSFKTAGMKISLDPGMQYPPRWTYQLPHAMFINQFGDAFDPTHQPGSNGLNAVFNQAVRDAQATHLANIFKHFGNDFFAVRLGWGYYGELNYPHPTHAGKKNCYWAFDPIAQGAPGNPGSSSNLENPKSPGLPQTLTPCPVPGWMPGLSSKNHLKARLFADWYLNALKDYHDWQITQTRKHYAGNLAMMMGSWGLRDGEIQRLIDTDLADDGRTEIQRGFDFARYIQGVTDPTYIVYCTWLDTPAQYCDDANTNPTRWSPIHYLANAAKSNPMNLQVWAENTGRGNQADMNLSFQRAKQFNIQAIIWAFEDDLFNKKYASLEEYHQCIKRQLKLHNAMGDG